MTKDKNNLPIKPFKTIFDALMFMKDNAKSEKAAAAIDEAAQDYKPYNKK